MPLLPTAHMSQCVCLHLWRRMDVGRKWFFFFTVFLFFYRVHFCCCLWLGFSKKLFHGKCYVSSIDGLNTIDPKVLFHFILFHFTPIRCVCEWISTYTEWSTHCSLLCFIHKITLNANITYWIGQESVVNWLRWKRRRRRKTKTKTRHINKIIILNAMYFIHVRWIIKSLHTHWIICKICMKVPKSASQISLRLMSTKKINTFLCECMRFLQL